MCTQLHLHLITHHGFSVYIYTRRSEEAENTPEDFVVELSVIPPIPIISLDQLKQNRHSVR